MTLYVIFAVIVAVVGGIFLAVRTKKSNDVIYNKMDKLGRITNILLAIVYVCLSPLYLFIGMICEPGYEGILGILGWIISILIASAPIFCGLGLGYSIAFRKQGKSKKSFMIQFLGVLGICLSLGLFLACYGNLLGTIN